MLWKGSYWGRDGTVYLKTRRLNPLAEAEAKAASLNVSRKFYRFVTKRVGKRESKQRYSTLNEQAMLAENLAWCDHVGKSKQCAYAKQHKVVKLKDGVLTAQLMGLMPRRDAYQRVILTESV